MTSPEPSATRPLRVAGLALLGVAAIALVIGLVSIFAGNGNGQADGGGDNDTPPSSTSAPSGSSTSSTSPISPTSAPPPSSSDAPTTTTTQSPAPTTPPGGDGNGEPGKATTQVRVLNNSTVAGLAGQAADDLRESGWSVAEVGNYSGGVIPTTTVYFRPGTAEESAAALLGDEFGMRVEPRFAGLEGFGPGLIVIVTGDYQGPGGEREPTDKNEK